MNSANHMDEKVLVEAPGTAPGSATLIPCRVYRHSRLPDTDNIGGLAPIA